MQGGRSAHLEPAPRLIGLPGPCQGVVERLLHACRGFPGERGQRDGCAPVGQVVKDAQELRDGGGLASAWATRDDTGPALDAVTDRLPLTPGGSRTGPEPFERTIDRSIKRALVHLGRPDVQPGQQSRPDIFFGLPVAFEVEPASDQAERGVILGDLLTNCHQG